jgi:hypothetical protein
MAAGATRGHRSRRRAEIQGKDAGFAHLAPTTRFASFWALGLTIAVNER